MTVRDIETTMYVYAQVWMTTNVANQIAKLPETNLTQADVVGLVEMMYVAHPGIDTVRPEEAEQVMFEYFNNGNISGIRNPDAAIKELCKALL